MHARRRITTDDRNESAAPLREQPPTADASTSPRALPRALATADLPDVADNPGAIEYASWIRRLRFGSA